MKAFFEDLFAYNFTMNEKLIQKLNELPEIPPKSASLFNHILSAHHIWNHRILNDKATLSVWPDILNSEYLEINTDNYHLSLRILKEQELGSIVQYTNTKGEIYSNSVQHILFHVINHSNYHRAQIATNMKDSGITPIVSDYIFFKR
jgi:uncharacterized damage-inducible protein DinB